MKDWTDRALAVRDGLVEHTDAEARYLDWLKASFGGAPLDVYLHVPKNGVLGTISVVFWDLPERGTFRGGLPKYRNNAAEALLMAHETGLLRDVLALNLHVSVRQVYLRREMAGRVVRKLPYEAFADVVKKLDTPGVTRIIVAVGSFRIFFNDDALMKKNETPEFKALAEHLLKAVMSAHDTMGFTQHFPGIYLESETELEEAYGGNQWQYFK